MSFRTRPWAFIVAAALLAGAPAVVVAAPPPLTLLETTPLPKIGAGDFDHFALDLQRNTLFVAAEKHGTIETFDLTSGAHLQSAGGVVHPHIMAFDAKKNQLIVADGGDASVKIFDGSSLRPIARIPVYADPDGGVFDPATRLFYVGNGGKAAHLPYSFVSIIAIDRRTVIGNIRVPGKTLKAIVIDASASHLFVSVRDKSLVAVIDIKRRSVVRTVSAPDLHANTPLALDAERGQLLVAGRKPNRFIVLNAATGAEVQHLDTVATADELLVDAPHRRVYITGSTGLDVYAARADGRYARIAHEDTQGGKTSIYVPSRERFYVVHGQTQSAASALQMYRVNP